jgi:hypothetical protein
MLHFQGMVWMIPDEPMVKALEKYYNVSGFSGVPQAKSESDYSLLLRVLETAQKGIGTKVVSWVPLVGGAIPDETQDMRIRLKVAMVDVKSGQWDMISPEPFRDVSVSARYTRESSDQDQVSLLKAKAYETAAGELAKRYAK